jgi:hypothetical protein
MAQDISSDSNYIFEGMNNNFRETFSIILEEINFEQ